MKNIKSFLAENIDKYNKKHKADVQLRRCLRCDYFDKTVYKCKEKNCIK